MTYMTDYMDAATEGGKALAAIRCSRRTDLHEAAWAWAFLAVSHARACGVEFDTSMLGDGIWPEMAVLRGIIHDKYIDQQKSWCISIARFNRTNGWVAERQVASFASEDDALGYWEAHTDRPIVLWYKNPATGKREGDVVTAAYRLEKQKPLFDQIMIIAESGEMDNAARIVINNGLDAERLVEGVLSLNRGMTATHLFWQRCRMATVAILVEKVVHMLYSW